MRKWDVLGHQSGCIRRGDAVLLSGDFFDGFLGAFVVRVGARGGRGGRERGKKRKKTKKNEKKEKKKRSGRKPGTLIINFSGHGQGTGKIIN